MIRSKPYIGSNDQLDSIIDDIAAHQKIEHDEGYCGGLKFYCPFCLLDEQPKESS